MCVIAVLAGVISHMICVISIGWNYCYMMCVIRILARVIVTYVIRVLAGVIGT